MDKLILSSVQVVACRSMGYGGTVRLDSIGLFNGLSQPFHIKSIIKVKFSFHGSFKILTDSHSKD